MGIGLAPLSPRHLSTAPNYGRRYRDPDLPDSTAIIFCVFDQQAFSYRGYINLQRALRRRNGAKEMMRANENPEYLHVSDVDSDTMSTAYLCEVVLMMRTRDTM